AEQLVADSPVPRLVLAPVGMDLSSDFGGECVSQARHRSPLLRRRPCRHGTALRYGGRALRTAATADSALSPPRQDDIERFREEQEDQPETDRPDSLQQDTPQLQFD